MVVKTKQHRTPIRIDFDKNPWDRKVKKMGRKFTAKVVAKHTGLSVHQVMGRRKKAGIVSNLKDRQGLTKKSKDDLARFDKLHGDVQHMQQMIADLLSGNKKKEKVATKFFMKYAG
jgi:hypothetical protein